jgi:hypothetical protein
VIHLISASQGAKIIVVSHQHTAIYKVDSFFFFLSFFFLIVLGFDSLKLARQTLYCLSHSPSPNLSVFYAV